MNPRRLRELKSFLDSIPPVTRLAYGTYMLEGNHLLGDLAMIVANPAATHMLLHQIYHSLVLMVTKEVQPKDDETLCYISQLLSFGCSAREMLMTGHFKFPKLDQNLTNKFYPLFSSLILSDLRREQGQVTERNIDQNLQTYCNRSAVAKKVPFFLRLVFLLLLLRSLCITS